MNKSKMMHRSAAAVLAALMMAAAGTTALAAETPGLSLGKDGAVAAGISLLQPDSTYYFPVQYTHPDGRTVVLPASEAEALELEVKEGTALESAAVPHLERPVLCPGGNRRGDPGRGHPRGGTHPAVQPPRGGGGAGCRGHSRAAAGQSLLGAGRGTSGGAAVYAALHRAAADGAGPAQPLASGDLYRGGVELYRHPHRPGTRWISRRHRRASRR